jgi:hypothetical protein
VWSVRFVLPFPSFRFNVFFDISELKELQNTYNALVVEVRALLDTHVRLRQSVQLPPQPQPSKNTFFLLLPFSNSLLNSNEFRGSARSCLLSWAVDVKGMGMGMA